MTRPTPSRAVECRPAYYLNPALRGMLRHFDAPLIEQAFANYAALSPEDGERLAQRIARFHRRTNTANPFATPNARLDGGLTDEDGE